MILTSLCFIISCTSAPEWNRCTPPDEIVSGFRALEPADWRTLSWEVASLWHATINPSALEATHTAMLKDDFCYCCEAITLSESSKDRSVHLRAVSMIHRSNSYDQAVTLADRLISAALGGKRAVRLLPRTEKVAVEYFGWTEPDRNTILNVTITQHSGEWLTNLYWARIYDTD